MMRKTGQEAEQRTVLPRVELVERFFSGTGPTYDQMAFLCTLGFDNWWKRKILQKVPRNARRIIDQASGTGILTFRIARAYPQCQVIGVELREEYLKIARQKEQSNGFENVRFILGKAEDVVLKGHCDCITSSYLAKYAETVTLVQNGKQMLRSGGRFVIHDFSYPSNPWYARVWELHFNFLQNLWGRGYAKWRTIFYELPDLLRQTEWVPQLSRCLNENGFRDIQIERFTFGASTIIVATRP